MMRIIAVIGFVVGMAIGSWAQEPAATAVPTASLSTATPTVDPEIQYQADKVTFCVDLVYTNYHLRTGIELRLISEVTYFVTDFGAGVVGIADSDDERLIGRIHFKCEFRDFMGETMMLTDVELSEGE